MTDRSVPQVRLPGRAEALLERWPVGDKDERAWEESTEAILTRVEIARVGSTDDALLAAPLPSEVGEGSISQPRSTPRPVLAEPAPAPVSLAELARLAVAEDKSANDRDVAREVLSAARGRTSSPAISEPTAPATQTPIAATATPVPSAVEAVPAPPPAPSPAPLLAAAPAVQMAQPTPAPRKRSVVVPLFAASLAVIGMAAAVVIVIRHQTRAEAPVAATPAPPVDHVPEPAATAAAEGKADLEIASPESLPAAKDGAEPSPAKPVARAAAPTPAGAPQPTAQPKSEVAKSEPAKPAEPTAEDKEAAKMKPAAQPTNVPQQPSNGAAQAAVAQVIGSARACVAGHDEPSRATIVFGSDGRVQSVAISGPAAGTPAEACIRAALSRARVEPFAKPTFSVGTTIRP